MTVNNKTKDLYNSNINKVIKAALNLFFFFEKISHTLKAQALKALKALKDTRHLGKTTKTKISE